jgi:hypothetical protein|tara:strand:+ start:544 stop:759 length:216 start_codon:yes stop_codon:yes gene_type:complete
MPFLMSTPMTTTTEDGNRQNIFAKEPPIIMTEVTETHNERAERLNGRLAMLGVIAALGAYGLTGQLIPGVW